MAHRQARPRRYLAGAYGPRRSGETEDRYIKAIESKAGKPAVVHHLLTYAVASDDEAESSGDDGNAEAGDFLNEFAVGKNGDLFPEGSRRLLKAGSKIRFDFHYHAVGKETVDQPPTISVAAPAHATVGTPLTLTAKVMDDGIPGERKPRPPREQEPSLKSTGLPSPGNVPIPQRPRPPQSLSTLWMVWRGPGSVVLDPDGWIKVVDGQMAVKASLSKPWTYVIRAYGTRRPAAHAGRRHGHRRRTEGQPVTVLQAPA
jgi:hypothetical protein